MAILSILLANAGFWNLWYWVLMLVAWTLVLWRTLGVPHDLILRAARLDTAAADCDRLARIQAARHVAVFRWAGVPLTAGIAFGLAAAATIGFGARSEAAQALFMLTAPLAGVYLASVRLAFRIEAARLEGPPLRQLLLRRRFWNQVIGTGAILAAAWTALALNPRLIF